MSIRHSIESKVSPENWEKMAETAGVSVGELQDRITDAIENLDHLARSSAAPLSTMRRWTTPTPPCRRWTSRA